MGTLDVNPSDFFSPSPPLSIIVQTNYFNPAALQ